MANPNGTPVWFDLNTPDADKAQAFYEAVAGWSFATSPVPEHGGYRMGGPGTAGVAGIVTPPPGVAVGPGGWTIYFASDDVDAMAEQVKSLGGQVHFGPTDIPQVGRFAVVADPQGVIFNIMKGDSPEDSAAFKPGQRDNDGHGVWTELATPDPDGAFAFYGKLFGWTKAGGMPMGEMGEYAFIGVAGSGHDVPGDQPNGPGAIMPITTTGAPARWGWYIHVPDIDAAADTAKAKGGTLLQEPMEIPGGEYAANVIDPQGFHIGLVGPRK